jgi:hypothetical protein
MVAVRGEARQIIATANNAMPLQQTNNVVTASNADPIMAVKTIATRTHSPNHNAQ